MWFNFPKILNFRNYEALVGYEHTQSDDPILKGIPTDDFRSTEPIQGSSLFQYGPNKPLKSRFWNFTKSSLQGIITVTLCFLTLKKS